MRTLIVVLLAMLLAVGLAWGQDKAGGAPTSGEKEALLRAIGDWSASCTGSARPSWPGMVDGWYDEITDSSSFPWGHSILAWWKDGYYADGRIEDPQFVDPDRKAWGEDYLDDNLDEGDAIMVATHGGENGPKDIWYGLMRIDAACGFRCNCDAFQHHIQVGDNDLEFLHLSSCNSMDEENWDDWEYSFSPGHATRNLHQINGFHGCMWISPAFRTHYEDFANDAYLMSICDSWLDNMFFVVSSGVDQCPVTMAVGASVTSVNTRITNEEYDFVYDDPEGGTYYVWDYISGCSPDCETSLP